MDADQLRATQAPLKQQYREDPEAALITLRARGSLDGDGISCSVQTGRAMVQAGLHPATGGDGQLACSGDLLLEALAACAGVTLRAVATALGIAVHDGSVHAEGDLDVRGTLGVDRQAPVGFRDIRLRFDLTTDADSEGLRRLVELTERYCVVLRTLADGPRVSTELTTGARGGGADVRPVVAPSAAGGEDVGWDDLPEEPDDRDSAPEDGTAHPSGSVE